MNRLIITIIFINLFYTVSFGQDAVSLSQDAANIQNGHRLVDDKYYTTFMGLSSTYIQHLKLYTGESTDERVKGSIMFEQEVPFFDSLASKEEDKVLFLVDVITSDTSTQISDYRYQALALFSYTFRDKYPSPHSLAFAIRAREALEELYLPLKDSIEMESGFTFEEGLANFTEGVLLQSTEKEVELAWKKSLALMYIILEEEGYLED